jgi:hypothetical protein
VLGRLPVVVLLAENRLENTPIDVYWADTKTHFGQQLLVILGEGFWRLSKKDKGIERVFLGKDPSKM